MKKRILSFINKAITIIAVLLFPFHAVAVADNGCDMPVLTSTSGIHAIAKTVPISSAISEVNIYNTTNGSTPITGGSTYYNRNTVSANRTIKAITVETGMTNSNIAFESYAIASVLPTPTMSPAPGTFTSAQTVTLRCTTSGATIRYTTDGRTPDLTSPVYSLPISVTSPTTIKAIAFKSKNTSSAMATGFYNVLLPVSAPAFSLVAGTYNTTQSITITSPTSGALIYYTTDGTTPTTNSTLYTGPVSVDISKTINAIAAKTGMTTSGTSTSSYVIKCASPTFTPGAGTYTTVQSVTLSSITPGVSIRFTTDGSDPSATSGTLYTVPITVNATYYEQIKAIAYKTGATNSDISYSNYVVTLAKVANPVLSPGAGSYNSYQSVSITSTTSGALIKYTTDGSQPGATNGTVYTGPISVTSNMQIIAYAYKDGMANSDNVYNSYTIQLLPADAPTFSPSAGAYTTPQNVTISSTTSGASIYYTTDGSTPTASSTLYNGTVAVAANTILTAIAIKTGMLNSQASNASYIIKCATPSITPASGTYNTIQSVSISTTTPDASIRYTTDGSDPSATNGTVYTTPIAVNATYYLNIKAIAYKTGITNSDIASNNYTVTLIKVANPVTSVAQGTYYTTQSVTITCPTPGASIKYTTDGSQPSASNGTLYTDPVTINAGNTMLNVYAYKDGMANSDIVYNSYYIQLVGVAAPTFNLAAGTYTGTQSVTLASTTSGASIYYTTDGTTPTTSSSQYSAPISISANTTLNAIAVKSGLANSTVATVGYIINCATPVLTPISGTYASAQVSISSTTLNASIYYTTDGTVPSSSSTLYNGSISVGVSETVKAIAIKTGMGNSAVASEAYTITAPLTKPIFTPSASTYNTPQSVTITPSISGASIRYTTDGSTPSDAIGTLYTSAIPVANNLTLKAIAYKSGMSNSAVTSGDYIINCAVPIISPASGSYNAAQTVTISSTTSESTIYYTTDGTAPTTSSQQYTGAITVGTSETINAIAIKSGMGNSGIASQAYTISLPVSAPTFTPAAGSYTSVQTVTIGSTTANTDIYYTLDGTDPTTSSPHYTGSVSVGSSLTLKAIAVKSGMTNSPITSGNYVILLPVSAPQFVPGAGTFTSAQSITITSPTSGASVYYTTDGTDPSVSSALYTVPVSITITTNLKAIAVKTGMSNSTITSGTFTILGAASDPTFSPVAGTYIGSQTVTLATTSAGAKIRYTTDGTAPSETVGTEYTSPISISANTTLKAIAYGTNYAKSSVVSNVYNIKVATPALSVLAGTYNLPQSLIITCTTVGAKVYYTTDGTDPSATNGTLYASAIPIPVSTNIKIIAINTGMTDSDPVSANYIINLDKIATPTFTPVAGTYAGSQTVTIASSTAGVSIIYTLDGTAPSKTNGTAYTAPVTIGADATLKAYAYKTNMIDSDIASGDYKIKPAVITFTPAPGNYTTLQSVVLACATPDAIIRYTIDGTVPSKTVGTIYTAAIALTGNTTVKAIAYKTGMEDGDVVSGDYTFQLTKVASPVYDPLPGTYTSPQTVTISSTTANAVIRYTTDGTIPTKTTGTVYTTPIAVSTTTTINAIAYATGFGDSDVASGKYLINLGGLDTDDDGVPDNQDDYPADPTRAYNNFYPGVGFGSLAFEDNWPFKADYDMNDMVVDYKFNQVTNSNNEVVEIKAKLVLRAMGATFHNGFGIEFPVLPSQVSSCVATLKNGSPVPIGNLVSIDPATGLEKNQSKAVVILYDDGYNVLPQLNSGIGVNTDPSVPFVTPDTINLVVTFAEPISSSLFTSSVYNPFIFTNKTRNMEVHLPNYPPTSLANTSLFGTGEDTSNPSSQRYYKTSNNLPWAINIYESYSYPVEKVAIVNAFTHFSEWAQSGGKLFTDWYKDLTGYREASSIYTNK